MEMHESEGSYLLEQSMFNHFLSDNNEREHNNMPTSKMIVLRGTAHWTKLVGFARPYTGNPKYNKGPYWSVDITPLNKSEVAKLKSAGIVNKLKEPRGEKETRTEPYLRLTILETRADGEKNDPPSIVDASGRAWGDDLIGNGSVVDVMIKVNDYGETTGVYYQKLRVLSLVPYEGAGFAPLSEDDEYFATGGSMDVAAASTGDASGTERNDGDVDDDIPF